MTKTQILYILIIICALGLAIGGCKAQPTPSSHDSHTSPEKNSKPLKMAKAPSMQTVKRSQDEKGHNEKKHGEDKPKSLPVKVPDEVIAMYKNVTLHLEKKDGSFKEDFVVKIGEMTKLGNSGLSINVSAFLPAFYMDQKRITSIGTKTTNPACKAAVFENGSEIHTGWFFAKMPLIHAFHHEIYSLTLVENKTKQ